ncbi:uncharacterized protein SCHCODRAFT_02630045 [Schizophyllum commune H4-8]|uniref:uncharacterized protein n=1 Tax=Schizophyllum commune (strain H4-8 / FGSC 9210) TaxID=578458 RepID=UPI00216085F7|nr:uncharacterized protein SCHCODRAFT_02630045 [Schizophyllum commune H4-8]KAI5891780.1 hypothetical protein SCHCODRAFT_02630045 [Schizophyllum commune H4-8]
MGPKKVPKIGRQYGGKGTGRLLRPATTRWVNDISNDPHLCAPGASARSMRG